MTKAKKITGKYNPLEPLRRDFNGEAVYIKDGEAIIDDPDLHTLMQFYRNSVKRGTLLDLCAGVTHFHYMAALEDKVDRITAFDLSFLNTQVLIDLYNFMSRSDYRTSVFAEKEDANILRIVAKSIASDKKYGLGRTGEGIIKNLVRKSVNKEGNPDLIIGDIYNPDNELDERKFDNILIGFSLYVLKNESDLQVLFSNIRRHLNTGGRVIIADFGDLAEGEILFQDEDLEIFSEDLPVLKKYHADYRLDEKTLTRTLEFSGFSSISIDKRPVAAEGAEKEQDLFYLLAIAEAA